MGQARTKQSGKPAGETYTNGGWTPRREKPSSSNHRCPKLICFWSLRSENQDVTTLTAEKRRQRRREEKQKKHDGQTRRTAKVWRPHDSSGRRKQSRKATEGERERGVSYIYLEKERENIMFRTHMYSYVLQFQIPYYFWYETIKRVKGQTFIVLLEI